MSMSGRRSSSRSRRTPRPRKRLVRPAAEEADPPAGRQDQAVLAMGIGPGDPAGDPVDDSDVRPVRHLVPAAGGHRDTSGWWTFFANPGVTFENYTNAWSSGAGGLGGFFLNSFVIVVPGGAHPDQPGAAGGVLLRLDRLQGPDFLFVAVFALQIVPLQVTLIPLQTIFVNFGLQNSFWPVWISHTIFGLPLAIFLLHNFMKEVPASIVEAARVDGAGHVKIFFVVLMPLLVPAIAAFGIFQFLWVWNDLLVATRLRAEPQPASRSPQRSPNCPAPRAVSGSCCPRVRSSRSSFRWPCSSACSATSSEACWPEASRAERRPGSEDKRSCPVHHSNPPASSRLRRCRGSHPQRCRGHSGVFPGCPRPPGWRSRKRHSQLGYFPSPSAAALTTGRTNAIGVDRAVGVAVVLLCRRSRAPRRSSPSRATTCCSTPSGRRRTSRPGGFDTRSLTKRVDGLLASNVPLADPSVLSLHDLRVPVVTIGTAVRGHVAASWSTTSRSAGRRPSTCSTSATGGSPSSATSSRRSTASTSPSTGTAATTWRCARPVSSPTRRWSQRTGFSIDGGEAAVHRMLRRRAAPASLPTAIFAVSDEVAMGVLYAAREHGLKVPADLSVIGVDGHDFAYLFDLTTVRQPVRDQGRIAARLLMEQINTTGPRPPSVVSVGAALIRRRTTGPVSARRGARHGPGTPRTDGPHSRWRAGSPVAARGLGPALGGCRGAAGAGRGDDAPGVLTAAAAGSARRRRSAEYSVADRRRTAAEGTTSCPSPPRRPTPRCSIAPRRADSPTRRSTSPRR